jgi:cytochrome b involved in lipid metabolism
VIRGWFMMNNRNLIFIFGLLIIVGLVSGCTKLSEDKTNSTDLVESIEIGGTSDNNSETQTGSDSNTAAQNNSDLPVQVSLEELKKHNSKEDCWVAYKGEVYDLTLFLPLHPGSAGAISPYCGSSSQFENAFTNQHGTSKVNVLLENGIFKGNLEI